RASCRLTPADPRRCPTCQRRDPTDEKGGRPEPAAAIVWLFHGVPSRRRQLRIRPPAHADDNRRALPAGSTTAPVATSPAAVRQGQAPSGLREFASQAVVLVAPHALVCASCARLGLLFAPTPAVEIPRRGSLRALPPIHRALHRAACSPRALRCRP